MNRVYLALGSNLANPLQQIQAALAALDALPETIRVATSAFYRTPPYGPADQPDYLNAVVALDTGLLALNLLEHTQRIELSQGRERKGHRYGPRTLDLDILLYGQQNIQTERLQVPHHDMFNRAFMLLPLSNLAPDLVFPDGSSLEQRLAGLDCSKIRLW
jgi:2-amino-4-hydroxy-6-hydroxymethyldihydropteridine diphosphokinase